MKRFMEFDLPGTDAPTADTEEVIEFKLAGQIFQCRPEVPAGLLLDLASAGTKSNGSQSATIEALLGFFRGALLEESYARFEAAIRDPKIVVPMSKISDIAGWLAEVYSDDRPTGGNSVSTSGSPSSGVGSTEVPSPGVLMYSRSEPTEPSTPSNGG